MAQTAGDERPQVLQDLSELAALGAQKHDIDKRLIEKIHEARLQGHSLREIGQAAGFSHQRIHQIVKTGQPE